MDEAVVKWVVVAYNGCDKIGSVLLEGTEDEVHARAKKWAEDVYSCDDYSVHQIS